MYMFHLKDKIYRTQTQHYKMFYLKNGEILKKLSWYRISKDRFKFYVQKYIRIDVSYTRCKSNGC